MEENNKSACHNTSSFSQLNIDNNWILTSVMIVINICTLVLNCIVIPRIIHWSKHKSFTKYFLISLAVADLSLGITVMPLNIVGRHYDTRMLLGQRSCDLVNSLDVMWSVLSITTLSILCFERYIAICRPFRYGLLCNRNTMVALSAGSWLLSASASFGLIMSEVHEREVEDVVRCLEMLGRTCIFVVNVYFATITSTVTILLPGAFIVGFNIRLMTRVHQRRKIMRDCSLSRQTIEARSMQVTRTIAVLTTCFLICWVPFNICVVTEAASGYTMSWYVVLAATWLGYLNSALNPALYLLLEANSCIGRSK